MTYRVAKMLACKGIFATTPYFFDSELESFKKKD